VYEKGTDDGIPHKIYITNFDYSSTNKFRILFLIKNPEYELKVGVKAFGVSLSVDPTGINFDLIYKNDHLLGWRLLYNAFSKTSPNW